MTIPGFCFNPTTDHLSGALAANYCAVNEDCYDITGQQDWGCRAGGTTPNLGQHGGATCHDQMLPCGDENCFKAYLSSTCCADGSKYLNASFFCSANNLANDRAS